MVSIWGGDSKVNYKKTSLYEHVSHSDRLPKYRAVWIYKYKGIVNSNEEREKLFSVNFIIILI